MNKVNILNVKIDNISMNEAVNKIISYTKGNVKRTVYTPNPEFIMEAQKDEYFKKILNEGDLVVPDGIGVILASKILRKSLKERVAGYDMLQNTFSKAKDKDISFFFLGASPGVAKEAAEKMRQKHKGLKILGVQDGYFKEEDEPKIIDLINNKKPDVLLVGLGCPKQEKWIYKYKEHLNVQVCIGVGGSFDGMSGRVKRAPLIYQKLGLEWFYRLLRQPKRIFRMAVLPKFLIYVIGGFHDKK